MDETEKIEPAGAFPYKPPSKELKVRYSHLFLIDKPVPIRLAKVVFDKLVALPLVVFSLPILIAIKLGYVIEGFFLPESRGPIFFSYKAVSAGKVFNKYKLRLIKEKYIDKERALKGEWIAFSAEWNEDSRTFMGQFIKSFYLDEIPQFFSVLKGDMTIVGPRPLSEMHYKRDIEQGNITRYLLRGGLLGLGHINKGTSEMGNPVYEYEYLEEHMSRTSLGILALDLKIIWKGIVLIAKGGGY